MNNICVVNINWLGDAIFTTPVFKALKDAYPRARVTCLCVPQVRDVLTHCPFVDRIIVYDEKGADRGVWRKIGLLGRLRRERFDAAFMLHRSLSRGLLMFLAGVPLRVGYTKAKWLLTSSVPPAVEGMHRSDSYLRVVEAAGIRCVDRSNSLRVSAPDLASVAVKLREAGLRPEDKFVVFNTGGNWELKRWPLSRWSELLLMAGRQAGLKVVFSGAAKDAAAVAEVIRLAGCPAVNWAGQTALGESLALFSRAAAVVSADSGPLHLANAVGAPVVGIFGPTRPEVTGPRGTGASVILFNDVGCNKAPCYHLACRSNVCMQSVGAGDVWQAVQKCLR